MHPDSRIFWYLYLYIFAAYASTTNFPSWKYWSTDTGAAETPVFPFITSIHWHPMKQNKTGRTLAVGGPFSCSLVEVTRAKPPAKIQSGTKRLSVYFPCWSDASEPGSGSEGEKGHSQMRKHSTADHPMSFSASKTSIIQPKLIVTGIYMYLQSSLSSARRFRH